MTSTDRDPEIERALSGFVVPEYPPQFFEELEVMLQHVDRAGESRSLRAPRPRFSGRRTLRWGLPALAAAVVLIVGIGILAPMRNDAPQPVLAAHVIDRTAERIGDIKAVAGNMEVRVQGRGVVGLDPNSPGQTTRAQFRLRSDGSFWTKSADPSVGDFAFDAETRVAEGLGYNVDPYGPTTIDELPGGPEVPKSLEGYRFTGVFPAGPDAGRINNESPWQTLASIVQDLRDAGAPTLETTTFDGRPAWIVSNDDIARAVDARPGSVRLTVDQETSFPVQAQIQGSPSSPTIDIRLSDLDFDPTLDSNAFRLAFPGSMQVHEMNLGAKTVSLSRVKEHIGYDAFTPSWLPEGYRLASVMVAEVSQLETQTNTDAMVSRNVVGITYRRGMQSVTISTRSAISPDVQWSDPLLYEGDVASIESRGVTLTAGAFGGMRAQQYGRTTAQPHLWGQLNNLVLVVQGDLSRSELVRVAESL